MTSLVIVLRLLISMVQVAHPLAVKLAWPAASGVCRRHPCRQGGRLVSFLGEDLTAQVDALVADIHAGTGDELFGLVLALSAK
jgi:hypothetical protein